MVQADRIKTIAVAGPTAVGKSDIALALAEKFDGELVGADSMQIYRGFDIGTGKLTKEECRGIRHWLIDVADGDAEYSVGNYVQSAREAIEDISSRKKLPIIVGGTGMYIYSLLSGCNFASSPKDNDVRDNIKLSAHITGAKTMHRLLSNIDEVSANNISSNDFKRVCRALEIYVLSGKAKSQAVAHEATPYNALTVVLTLPRDVLYERIDRRVHKMFENGLIDEANGLLRYRDCGSMQALGYKQIAENPTMSGSELEQLVAQKTRNYAKRQMTYFNNMKLDKVFIDARDTATLEKSVKEFLE